MLSYVIYIRGIIEEFESWTNSHLYNRDRGQSIPWPLTCSIYVSYKPTVGIEPTSCVLDVKFMLTKAGKKLHYSRLVHIICAILNYMYLVHTMRIYSWLNTHVHVIWLYVLFLTTKCIQLRVYCKTIIY